MAQYINTNSLSLITQNNINKNQSALSSSIERLSSGLRINSAKDDAAGQAIANRFTSNIKGLTQAARNANDGISVAQTTEGALSEINNNLQRVRELTVQASTGTNSASDLSSIQDEIKSRLSEIDRVSGQTQFNGVNVLAKDGKMSIQVGANDGETIDIDLKKIDSTTLGLNTFNVTGPVSAAGEFGKTGTATAVTDFTKYYGATTQVADATVAEKGAANDLSTRLGLGAGGAAFADDVFAELGVAKGADRKAGLETLFFEPEGEGFSLPPDSPALHVIQHIRDESHDHAISGHRKKRAKVKNTSTLETIEGVGPKRRQMLLKYMGGLQGLLNASMEEIAKVPGISQGLAEKIYYSLKH